MMGSINPQETPESDDITPRVLAQLRKAERQAERLGAMGMLLDRYGFTSEHGMYSLYDRVAQALVELERLRESAK